MRVSFDLHPLHLPLHLTRICSILTYQTAGNLISIVWKLKRMIPTIASKMHQEILIMNRIFAYPLNAHVHKLASDHPPGSSFRKSGFAVK